jgi:hypothetical protein
MDLVRRIVKYRIRVNTERALMKPASKAAKSGK